MSAKLHQSTTLFSPDCNLIEGHYHLTALQNHVSSTQTSYWRKQKKILDMGIWCGNNVSYMLRPPSMCPRHISCCASVDCHVPSSVMITPGMVTFGLYLFVEFDFRFHVYMWACRSSQIFWQRLHIPIGRIDPFLEFTFPYIKTLP